MVAWVLIGTNLKSKSRTDRPVSVAGAGGALQTSTSLTTTSTRVTQG